MEAFFQDRQFSATDVEAGLLTMGEYENCTFSNCDLGNTDLAGFIFVDCEFIACNLSMARLSKTAFRQVHFKDCKMMGLRIDECNQFALELSFSGCTLDHSSFYQLKLPKTKYIGCRLVETDFTSTDLSSAIFDNCDLSGATFDNTNLEKADLRTAYNYSINPANNKVKKAKFSLAGIPGLLHQYNIEIEH